MPLKKHSLSLCSFPDTMRWAGCLVSSSSLYFGALQPAHSKRTNHGLEQLSTVTGSWPTQKQLCNSDTSSVAWNSVKRNFSSTNPCLLCWQQNKHSSLFLYLEAFKRIHFLISQSWPLTFYFSVTFSSKHHYEFKSLNIFNVVQFKHQLCLALFQDDFWGLW